MAEVTLAPEIIATIGGFRISNTIAATVVADAVLLSGVLIIRKNLSEIPGKFQSIVETLVGTLYDTTEQIAGRFTSQIFPWFASFFIFIFVTNIMGLLPGFGSVGFYHYVHGEKVLIPLLRAATSDFNTTLGLAVVSLVATHAMAIRQNGLLEYAKRFFSFNPIYLFVGLLELVSEFTKVVSLSFRLFGNIYAGEVVIHTITSLAAFVAPIPFLLLETIVAFVQALVFSMLTMVFMTILIKPHHEAEGGER